MYAANSNQPVNAEGMYDNNQVSLPSNHDNHLPTP